MAGKGSAPRPKSVDDETFSDNWERTFGVGAVNAASPYKRANEITEEHLQADRPARLN